MNIHPTTPRSLLSTPRFRSPVFVVPLLLSAIWVWRATPPAAEIVSTTRVAIIFLPIEVARNDEIFTGIAVLFSMAATAWLVGIIPWFTSLIAKALFIVCFGTICQWSTHISHTSHLLAQVLGLLACTEITDAINGSCRYQNNTLGIRSGILALISIFLAWAGVSKLYYSGWAWADGVSLQSWVHAFAPPSFIKSALLGSRTLCIFLQVSVVLGETLAAFFLLPAMSRNYAIMAYSVLFFSFWCLFGYWFWHCSLLLLLCTHSGHKAGDL